MNRFFSVNHYKRSLKTSAHLSALSPSAETAEASVIQYKSCENNGAVKNEVVFQVKKRLRQPSGISLIWEETDWSTNHYVFAPAALYDGNRFACIKKDYPPMLTEEEQKAHNGETVISDVPRLSEDGNGFVQLAAGDLATPCIGWFSKEKQKGVLLFFEQENELGNFGITISENAGKKTARFILSSPCVREGYRYGMCSTRVASTDCGARLKAGDTVTFRYTEYSFACDKIAAFQNHFFAYRAKTRLPGNHPNTVPWSYAWHIIEEKYNRRNWVDAPGFYKSSEAHSGIYRQWQTGWVGGAMNTLPALALGTAESVEKSRQTLDFIFKKLQHSSGFLYGVYCDGTVYGDHFCEPENQTIVMSRKNADALYYLIRQLMLFQESGTEISPLWQNGVQRLADAFLSFYQKNGEMGQFIDIEHESLYIGGSTSAALAPAGLALCGAFFKNVTYRRVAQEIAQKYYESYASKGYTNAGPGEILSAPDSESAFALLESYVVLYSLTNDEKWLRFAVDIASLCAGWCVSYDYRYDRHTQFLKRHIATTGAVWANVQNKHAAPGICTLSGASLFRLFRATGDKRYLQLCKDVAHNLTQFVSTPENPIYASYIWHNRPAVIQKEINAFVAKCALAISKKKTPVSGMASAISSRLLNPVGRINERVNLSDWEGKNNVGEIPNGSCWCEVSAMLTYLELPAIYVQPDAGFCFVLDHAECCVKDNNEENIVLSITNPTQHSAAYRLFAENRADCRKPLREMFFLDFRTIQIDAYKTKHIVIEKRRPNA